MGFKHEGHEGHEDHEVYYRFEIIVRGPEGTPLMTTEYSECTEVITLYVLRFTAH